MTLDTEIDTTMEQKAESDSLTDFRLKKPIPLESGILIWPTESSLLDRLAEQLLAHSDEELKDCLVILPTQRLATCLLAILGSQKNAFRPPQIKTLESFIRNETALANELPGATSDLIQELVLGAIIKENDYKHLRTGHEHELKQFFTDLAESGQGVQGFSKLKEAVHENFFHSEEHTSSLNERFEEMEDLHKKFFEALEKKNQTNGTIALAERSEYLKQHWRGATELPWHWVHIACFTTVKSFVQPLMAELVKKDNVTVYLSKSPELFGQIKPLTELATAISPEQKSLRYISPETKSTLINNSKTEPATHLDNSKISIPPTTSLCRIHACRNILMEVAESITLAESYISKGYDPSEVAILLANENLHGKFIRSLLRQRETEANLAIGLTMSQTTFGTWAALLSDLVLSNEDAEAILAFATHPLTLNWLLTEFAFISAGDFENPVTPESQTQESSDSINQNESQTDSAKSLATTYESLKSLLGLEICSQKSFAGFETIIKNCRSYAAKKAFELIHDSLGKFIQVGSNRDPVYKSLGNWMENLRDVFAHYRIFEQRTLKDQGILSSMVTASNQFFDQITESQQFFEPDLNLNEFWRVTRDKFLSLDVRSVGYPLKGLQVLSVVEARYVPFKVAIVLGCTEGNFPKALPSDNLVDDWLKSRIGLPGWKYVEALEDTTFHLMLARLPQLELFYSEDEKGDPTVRSRFIESLICQELATVTKHDSDENLIKFFGHPEGHTYSPTSELEILDSNSIGKFPHPRDQLIKRMSATALKKLITCPYKFLLSRLRVDSLSLPQENKAMIEGEWLHEILECFYTSVRNGEEIIEKLDLTQDQDSTPKYAADRLNQLTNIIIPPSELNSPFYFHLIRYSWPKFAEHYTNITTHSKLKDKPETFKEFKIGDSKDEHQGILKIENYDISIKGSVDSIDSYEQGYLLTDYKRKRIETASDVQEGISPQLALYAKAMAELTDDSRKLPLSQGIIGYWSILAGEWKAHGVGESARTWGTETGLISRNTPNSEELFSDLEEIWGWRIQSLIQKQENFLPDPSEDNWCNYCEFVGVCRKNDPQFRDLINSEAQLAPRLEAKKIAKKAAKLAAKEKAAAMKKATKKVSTKKKTSKKAN